MKVLRSVAAVAAASVVVAVAAAVLGQFHPGQPGAGIGQLPEPMPSSTPNDVNDADRARLSMPAAEGEALVRLEFELPRPVFKGTDHDIRVANLEKLTDKAREVFLAPAGTKNVASGKPVSSSDEFPIIGELEMVTDGDKEAADGSYVELGPRLQHVTVDLETEHEIYAVLVWHYHKQKTVYFDVVVQVAEDADFTKNVVTLFNNDVDNSAGLGVGDDMHYIETYRGKLIDAKGVHGRYVRLYSNGNTAGDLNHYTEVEVYGRQAGEIEKPVPLKLKLPRPAFSSHRSADFRLRIPNLEKARRGPRPPLLVPAGTLNLALGRPVSSTDKSPLIGKLSMITDGKKDEGDYGLVELGPGVQSITIDLEKKCDIYAMALWHYHRQLRAYFDVIVQVSDDRDFAKNVTTLFNNDHDNSAGLGAGRDKNYIETYEGKLIDAKGVSARYVRLYGNGNDVNELNHYVEVEVYGRAAE